MPSIGPAESGYATIMSRDRTFRPRFPTVVATRQHDGVLGRIRSRTLGQPQPGVPEVVMVHGMTAADYLLPGLAELATWTRAHLIDLPGCGGSGDPPHELSVAEFADAVADWLHHQNLGRIVLAGHSSGTQVAAEATLRLPGDVAGVVLASPVFDPAWHGLPHVLYRWWLDERREPPSLEQANQRDRRRAGGRRLLHVLRLHLRHRLEDPVTALRVPVLIVRGRDDALCTPQWAQRLAQAAAEGGYVEVAGAYTFCWRYPQAWSPAIRAFAARLDSDSA
jgi:pimeloyl-ACP methyl ester carboxylesterase